MHNRFQLEIICCFNILLDKPRLVGELVLRTTQSMTGIIKSPAKQIKLRAHCVRFMSLIEL